ncbi:MAG: hypothetical protein ACOCTQ_00390 [Planctomycetota bacterium]
MTEYYPQHELTDSELPDDSRRVLPLIGNDEIKLCVDGRGVMHDFTVPDDVWSGISHPPPRIVWAGRRHTRRADSLNSNLFEWGFLALELLDEEQLPPVTGWRQRLHPREGLVETEIERGEMTERCESFVHLEENVVVFHREYTNLPDGIRPRVRATYTLCRDDVDEVPFHMHFSPLQPTKKGIAADTVAHGVRTYRGRVGLSADQSGSGAGGENTLEFECDLAPDGSVTIYLTFADDLGNDDQMPPVSEGDWMAPVTREVLRERNREKVEKPDPADTTDRLQKWIEQEGYDGLRRSHVDAWGRFREKVDIRLPAEEREIRAAVETHLYNLRTTWTRWSMPPNPFNSSWGAPYFWDERFGYEGLLDAGVDDLPRRVVEWRRRILPYAVQMTSGRGARYPWVAMENGAALGDHSKTHHFSYAHLSVIANYTYCYCRRHDDPELWRRYYPILREVAEFYRWWLLVELPGNMVMVVPTCDINESDYPQQDGPFTLSGAVRVMNIAREVADRLDVEEPATDRWKELEDKALATIYELYPKDTTADGITAPKIAGFEDYDLHLLPEPDLDVDSRLAEERLKLRRKAAPPDRSRDLEWGGERPPEQKTTMPWGRFMKTFQKATRWEAAEALESLRYGTELLKDFQVMPETVRLDDDGWAHPWFATAAGAYIRAINRMLAYPRGEDVTVAPGVPEEWEELSYRLPIDLAGRVEVAIKEGTIQRLVVREESGPHRRRIIIPAHLMPGKSRLTDVVKVEKQDESRTVLTLESTGETEIIV